MLESTAKLPLNSRRQQGFTQLFMPTDATATKGIVGTLLRHQIV